MGRPTLDKKNTEFKMRMSETEKNKLKELADFYKMSMSEVIMMLIDEDYKLVIEEQSLLNCRDFLHSYKKRTRITLYSTNYFTFYKSICIIYINVHL